jgi:hypothetical protein
LEPVVVEASKDRRRSLFTGAAALAQPVFDGGSDGDVPDAAGFATLHGLYWLLVAVADGGPLLLAIDDMHWSDAPSERFLSFLGLRLDGLSGVCCWRRDRGSQGRKTDRRPDTHRTR